MPDLRPIDMVREAVKAGHDDAPSVVAYVKSKYNHKLLPNIAGRILVNVRGEQKRAVGALMTGSTEGGDKLDEAVCRDVQALIKKHGLPKVQTAVEVAAWFIG